MNTNVQYITDEAGHKTAVIMDIADYERMMEDMHDLAAIAERRDEPSIAHKAFIAGLKKDGVL